MATVTVFTRQHRNIVTVLETAGRYAACRENVLRNEDARLMLECYDWLVAHHPRRHLRPVDADYPIWLSYRQDAAILPNPDTVLLELEVDEADITPINIAKWGAINNFSYIPLNEKDARQHRELMEAFGVTDAKACMTQFYPQLRRKIIDSWDRLFDDTVQLGNDLCYGLIWEVRSQWVRSIR